MNWWRSGWLVASRDITTRPIGQTPIHLLSRDNVVDGRVLTRCGCFADDDVMLHISRPVASLIGRPCLACTYGVGRKAP